MAIPNDALTFTLKWEGGYVNNPNDYGGATNYGVTQRTYDSWRRGKGLAPTSVKNITKDEVTQIYEMQYWVPTKCARMEQNLAIVMFDTAINFGVGGAFEFLQEAGGLTPDGIWGPASESVFQKNNNISFARKIIAGRKAYRHKRVKDDPSQKVFLQGWLNRDDDLLDFINERVDTANAVKSRPITAKQDTWLKKSSKAVQLLADDQKVFVPKGKSYSIVWQSSNSESGHVKVSLASDAGNWYVFPGHWNGLSSVVNPDIDKPVQGRPRKCVYYSQRDNYRDASRTCFSSSCAMLLKWYKPNAITSDDQYIKTVFQIGDTTIASVQVAALKRYGLEVEYTQSMSIDELKDQLDRGPVAIGILHKGPSNAPYGGGHWIFIEDYKDDKTAPGGAWFFVNDPWGEIDNASGIYDSTNGEHLKYSANLLKARWTVSNPNDGWAVFVP